MSELVREDLPGERIRFRLARPSERVAPARDPFADPFTESAKSSRRPDATPSPPPPPRSRGESRAAAGATQSQNQRDQSTNAQPPPPGPHPAERERAQPDAQRDAASPHSPPSLGTSLDAFWSQLSRVSSGGELADVLDHALDQADRIKSTLDEALGEWVSDRGDGISVGLATAASLLLEVGSAAIDEARGKVDVVRFGEGLAQGTVAGMLEDAGRLAAALPSVRTIKKLAGRIEKLTPPKGGVLTGSRWTQHPRTGHSTYDPPTDAWRQRHDQERARRKALTKDRHGEPGVSLELWMRQELFIRDTQIAYEAYVAALRKNSDMTPQQVGTLADQALKEYLKAKWGGLAAKYRKENPSKKRQPFGLTFEKRVDPRHTKTNVDLYVRSLKLMIELKKSPKAVRTEQARRQLAGAERTLRRLVNIYGHR